MVAGASGPGATAAVALLCPGQGSQKVGMGKDLAEAFPEARRALEAVDEALGFRLSAVMWEGPEDLLTRTDHAQPAILAHSAAAWAVAGPKLAGRVTGAAGHSLGEYSAYVAGGALGLADAARLVRRRGELMHEAGTARPGTMAAVMGLDAGRVAAACREASGAGGVAVAANLNAPDQIVISGDPAAVELAGTLLKAAGAKRVIPLKVSGAFHSPLMAPAAARLGEALAAAPLGDPAFPVVANASAEPVRTAAAAREQLAEQLTSPVRWVESVQALGRLAGEGATFVEVGPGAVLTGLAKRIVAGCRTLNLGTAAEVRAFLEAG
ncbi:MAG TPA: ACP S-malonyltransferase [Gemmatimonadales bacterium]|nr:ACP S-malonyltransferase [Gemmatimonadales bacterium]